MADPNLVTTCTLHGHEFLIKMNVVNNYLELLITDKQSGEEWQCSYNNAYIENLTHKTGNFKQFEVFVTMLKSGLLKTSSSISLDLLTYEDLESLRIRTLKSNATTRTISNTRMQDRRYLILNYSVEFDRIHYPLPLEYCGPPDPVLLQATIRKLESELSEAREQVSRGSTLGETKQMIKLENRIEELYVENQELQNELQLLRNSTNHRSKHTIHQLQRAISNLEKSVVVERKSHHELVEKLRKDKIQLRKEMEKLKESEKNLRSKLQQIINNNVCLRNVCRSSFDTVQTMYRRRGSASPKPKASPRNRSLSPKVTKSDGWDERLPKSIEIRYASGASKSPSRESSADRIKLSDLEELCFEMEGAKGEASFTSRVKKKKLPRTRPSSTSSNESAVSARSHKSIPLRRILDNNEIDFKAIGKRVERMQSLFKSDHK